MIPSTPPHGFRTVPGFDGYAVSHNGDVSSCRGPGGRITAWHRLKPMLRLQRDATRQPRGYLTVHVRMPDGRRRKLEVHVLVLLTFVGSKPRGLEACHKNGRYLDNSSRNLRWGTRGSNTHDRYVHGNGMRGTMFKRAKLNDEAVRVIRVSTENYLVLAQRYGIGRTTIYSVRNRQSWTHVLDKGARS